MKILSALFLCVFYVAATGQTHTPSFPTEFMHIPTSLSTQDGGKISVNTTKKSYGKGMGDILLTKTDARGNEEWFQSYGGTSYDLSSSLALTQDGGYILIGSTSSFGAGNYDVYVIKTDVHGKEVWSHTYGSFPNEYGQSIQELTNGDYLITASSKRYPTQEEARNNPRLVWTFEIDQKGREIK